MFKKDSKALAHICCVIVIILWGSAIVASKMALQYLTPVEVVVLRFICGYATLWIIAPKWLKLEKWLDELACLACGFTGVSLYFLLQNLALPHTSTTNVSIILALSPMFTAICMSMAGEGERIKKNFHLGFIISICGVVLVVSNGQLSALKGGLLGDVLVLFCTISWGIYSVVLKRLKKYPTLLVTRRIFFYGLITMIPFALVMGFSPDWSGLLHHCLPNVLYMGCFASAIAYVLWNRGIEILGPVKTDIYRYMMPVATIIFSAIFLGEQLTPIRLLGVVITLAGLLVSQGNIGILKKKKS